METTKKMRPNRFFLGQIVEIISPNHRFYRRVGEVIEIKTDFIKIKIGESITSAKKYQCKPVEEHNEKL